jgi:hypothetical protein
VPTTSTVRRTDSCLIASVLTGRAESSLRSCAVWAFEQAVANTAVATIAAAYVSLCLTSSPRKIADGYFEKYTTPLQRLTNV